MDRFVQPRRLVAARTASPLQHAFFVDEDRRIPAFQRQRLGSSILPWVRTLRGRTTAERNRAETARETAPGGEATVIVRGINGNVAGSHTSCRGDSRRSAIRADIPHLAQIHARAAARGMAGDLRAPEPPAGQKAGTGHSFV